MCGRFRNVGFSKFPCTQPSEAFSIPSLQLFPVLKQIREAKQSVTYLEREQIYLWQILWPFANIRHVHKQNWLGEGRQRKEGGEDGPCALESSEPAKGGTSAGFEKGCLGEVFLIPLQKRDAF